ncbi:hypothetical protein D3C86_2066250 [compost metagenome]
MVHGGSGENQQIVPIHAQIAYAQAVQLEKMLVIQMTILTDFRQFQNVAIVLGHLWFDFKNDCPSS